MKINLKQKSSWPIVAIDQNHLNFTDVNFFLNFTMAKVGHINVCFMKTKSIWHGV